jgi:hypothetical protein
MWSNAINLLNVIFLEVGIAKGCGIATSSDSKVEHNANKKTVRYFI